jgi:GNAT superfamily N-acetyltransferase
MDIPDLPPDISFNRLSQTPEAIDFAFEVKRAALGPHIIARWEWDEAFQRNFHERQFRDRPVSRIMYHRQPVGTVALTAASDHIRLDDFYLFPAHHGRGLGARILKHCLAIADAHGKPVRLQHLKWNPVGSLYRRHRFSVIDETESHFIMERQPGGADLAS